jgi:hypothetical protein
MALKWKLWNYHDSEHRLILTTTSVPVPGTYREQILINVCVENVSTPKFLKYREVHDVELIVSVHEIVEMIGTNFVC